MTLSTPPPPTLSILPSADGSAFYSQNGHTVLCAVNAPIEAQRRDELPSEATIEVNVRPAVGIGGVRERHLETLIHATLRTIILTTQHPRSLIQITLQTTDAPPESEPSAGHSSQHVSVRFPLSPSPCLFSSLLPYPHPPLATSSLADRKSTQPLPLLPALLQTALLALLAASVPLSTTYTTALLAVPRSSSSPAEVVVETSPTQLRDAASVHVLTFSAGGELLLAESEGGFEVGVWERVVREGERVCRGRGRGGGQGVEMDVDVDGEGPGRGMRSGGLEAGLREVVGGKVEGDSRWRDGVE